MLTKTLSIVTATALVIAALAPVDRTFAQDQSPRDNTFWWPKLIDVSPLRLQSPESNPFGSDFDYASEFNTLDLDTIKAELKELMTTSQDWWPADYGHYGPFFIRMAWHSAGTYRTVDGRGGAAGGQLRFEPLNSWPDNGNLDKARRLLWPIKAKYGRKISWADLMVLTGNVALESMGFQTIGFGGGREDDWEPDLVYWGPEKDFLDDERYDGTGKERKLQKPLGAVQLGLIYVNPEGPGGNHDPLDSAQDIRETFGRMAMNDEETVALVAGGHTFGKAHGAHAGDCNGAAPAGADLEEQGFGWKNKCGSGVGADTVTSGLEGTSLPTQWTMQFLTNLYAFEWVQTKSPAGATQWIPDTDAAANLVPDAHDATKRHAPIMLTSDLALREDPAYDKISRRFLDNPKEFELAFAKAWYKLTHRDLGPKARYLGSQVPAETMIWQDEIPEVDHKLVTVRDIAKLKAEVLDTGLSNSELVRTAWASAVSFRSTDMRGGANGARLRLEPQKSWAANNPVELENVLATLEGIQKSFNDDQGAKQISMADMIVLAGAAGIENAAKEAGKPISVPFTAGRADASQAQTDVASFSVLEPTADGFRNYYASDNTQSPINMMIDRASMLSLSVPEMTVLVGGLRALDANTGGVEHGVLTNRPGKLSNDFFINLLDMSTKWTKSATLEGVYEGSDRVSGEAKWTATPVDLAFGSSSELRSVAEVYASSDGEEKFMKDFVAAWTKVMQLDRFDLKNNRLEGLFSRSN